MAFSKAQWSLVRKLEKTLQETRKTQSRLVTLVQERTDLEKSKAEVEASNSHEYDLLLALIARLYQVSAKITEEERRLELICKKARFLGAELDRPENFPSEPLAFRVEEGVCCWADFYSLATTWIRFVLRTGILGLPSSPNESGHSDLLLLELEIMERISLLESSCQTGA